MLKSESLICKVIIQVQKKKILTTVYLPRYGLSSTDKLLFIYS